MHPWQTSKTVNALTPQSVGTAGVTGTTIDTKGARWLQIDVHLNSATAQPTAMALLEGDSTSAVSTAIPQFTGHASATSTSAYFVIPTFDSAASQVMRFNVDLRNRKRYLAYTQTSPAAQITAARARLEMCDGPVTDAQHGCAEIVTG
jgi:hypothetical protein